MNDNCPLCGNILWIRFGDKGQSRINCPICEVEWSDMEEVESDRKFTESELYFDGTESLN